MRKASVLAAYGRHVYRQLAKSVCINTYPAGTLSMRSLLSKEKQCVQEKRKKTGSYAPGTDRSSFTAFAVSGSDTYHSLRVSTAFGECGDNQSGTDLSPFRNSTEC